MLEYHLALLVVSSGKGNAGFCLAIVHKVCLVRSFKPFLSFVRKIIVHEHHGDVQNVVWYIVFVNALYLLMQETVSSFTIVFSNHNFSMQVQTIKIQLVGNLVDIYLWSSISAMRPLKTRGMAAPGCRLMA